MQVRELFMHSVTKHANYIVKSKWLMHFLPNYS